MFAAIKRQKGAAVVVYLLNGTSSKGITGSHENPFLVGHEPESNLGQVCALANACEQVRKLKISVDSTIDATEHE